MPVYGRALACLRLAPQCYHRFMANKNVRFVAIKTVKKPARIKFKTKSGKTVSFRAVKTVERKRVVRFRAKR